MSVMLYHFIACVALLMDLFVLCVAYKSLELDHMCLLSSCYFFVLFCLLCGRVRVCSFNASYHLLYCACLRSVRCL